MPNRNTHDTHLQTVTVTWTLAVIDDQQRRLELVVRADSGMRTERNERLFAREEEEEVRGSSGVKEEPEVSQCAWEEIVMRCKEVRFLGSKKIFLSSVSISPKS